MVQLPKLNAHNEALIFEKNEAKNAKADVVTKAEQLLNDKADLKKLHQEVKVELKKLKTLFF